MAARRFQEATAEADALALAADAAAAAAAAKRAELAALALLVQEEEELAHGALAPLPSELAFAVFMLLPLDSRLRCREVCRAWRACLEDVRFWTVADLRPSTGVRPLTDGLLLSASARACGQMTVLDLTGCSHSTIVEVLKSSTVCKMWSRAALQEVARANLSLTEIRAWDSYHQKGAYLDYVFDAELVSLLIATLPELRLLQCDFWTDKWNWEVLGIPAVRVREAIISGQELLETESLADAMRAHRSLTSLRFWSCDFLIPDIVGSLVDLAIASRLETLELQDCRLALRSVPHIARLVASPSLTELRIAGGPEGTTFFADLPTFCGALRTSTLTKLDLSSLRFGVRPTERLLTVFSALMGHPTLKVLHLTDLFGSIVAPYLLQIGIALGRMASAPSALESLLVDGKELILRPT